MNFIAQVEEHLRDLGAEARKNHPGVKEASERAILVLRTLQNKYVTEVRKATKAAAGTASHPTTALFQSQDLLRPFLLAVNYPNASIAMLEISFRAIRLLIEGHAICPGDGIHLIRVWTIQAQVCASQYNKKKKSAGSNATTTTAAITSTPSASSSSWFGGFSFTGGGSSAASSATPGGPYVAVGSGVVSSSSGQSGATSTPLTSKLQPQHKREYDRFAVEILACLVMLLELPDLILTPEQWSASVALCCILLGIDETSNTIVPQAAKSTLKNVLSILYQQNDDKNGKTTTLERATWMDLLYLATSGQKENVTLKGAFCNCTLVSTHVGGSGLNPPPSPNLCLELLHLILQQRPDLFGPSGDADGDAFTRTAVTLMDLMRKTQSFGTLWRLLQLACTIITTQQDEWKAACRELLLELIYALSSATDACRNHDDFEDGYIYTVTAADSADGTVAVAKERSGSTSSGGARRGSASLHATTASTSTKSLIPDMVLWKAALVLEVLYKLLQEQNHVIFEKDGTLVALLTEAVSDFATVCSSCRENMLQVVDCAKEYNNEFEPDTFHRAEEIGKSFENGSSGDIAKNTQTKGAGGLGTTSQSPHFPPCEIGEPVWIAFHCILLVCQSLKNMTIEGNDTDEDDNLEIVASVMDGSFAPSLAVLQHYLKRFPGSSTITKRALAGYTNLAHVAIPASYGTIQQKKALLSSLCKLSLPMWGKHDSTSQLQDHHVSALLCLLKIVHVNYESILSEWHVVLWTLEELSTLSISSPMLSNEGYLAALDVSHAFARIAPLTACFSVESLENIIDALADISRSSSLETRTDRTASDGEYVITPAEKQSSLDSSYEAMTERRGSKDFNAGNATKDSIGGKLMSFAGRAMVSAGIGSSSDPNNEEAKNENTIAERPIPADQRTKNSYFDNCRHDFAKRMGESKRTTSNNDVFGQLPFALVALTDVAMSNAFRFESCGTHFLEHLCSLAGVSSVFRAYSMDTIAMFITSQIAEGSSIPSRSAGPRVIVDQDPNSSGLWIVREKDADDSSGAVGNGKVETQSLNHEALLSPLCDCIMKTERSDVAEAAISALHSILEGVGHNVNGTAWTVVIDAVSSLSGDPYVRNNEASSSQRSATEWSNCCLLAFRCVKLIVDDFLDHLPPPLESSSAKGARTALLDCCSSFGSSRHDVNTSLTAIGMLWTIADQDPDPNSIDHAFSRLVFLSSDNRAEVRNCAVNTLFSCIVGRGQQFSAKRWRAIMSETIFTVFDRIRLRGEGDTDNEANGVSHIPQDDQQNSRYKVSVHHSRDSADKQWATTQVMALRGLTRVLRNFFSPLLLTMEDEHTKTDETQREPWFLSAWERILHLALTAAMQLGGRDTLELRNAGVDLLILCSQLSCRDGIGAVTTPARVSTNMEVVNGALRSVRETNAGTQDRENQRLFETEMVIHWREKLFEESFISLERLGRHFDDGVIDVDNDESSYIETTHLQVMQNLAVGLGKLYECCKEEEFLPNVPVNGPFLAVVEETVEDRFVGLVATVAKQAVGDPDSSFLTQAQRASFDLLRTMTSNSSSAALKVLASLAARSFLWVSDGDDDDEEETDLDGSELLGQEAARVVATGIGNESLPSESKAEVLYRVLKIFVEENRRDNSDGSSYEHKKRCYDTFVPVIQKGLHSALSMEEVHDSNHGLNELWERMLHVSAILLSPGHIQACGRDPVLTTNVLEIVAATRATVPIRLCENFCAVLTSGASNSLEVLKDNFPATIETVNSNGLSQSEEVLKLLKGCLSAACDLAPQSTNLRSVCELALQDALTMIGEAKEESMDSNLGVRIAVVVCGAFEACSRPESLVIEMFPVLCRLTGVDHSGLRRDVGALLGRTNLPQVLADAEERAQAAENRAEAAERQISVLRSELDALREENETLHQQVTVFSTASALT